MSITSTLRRTISIAAIGAVSATAAFGATASGATIGSPDVLGPGANLPINVPGYREPADNKIKPNYRLVRRDVAVARGERASVVMTAPKGFRAVTIAFGDGRQVGGGVDGDYAGKRSVRVKLFVNSDVVKKGEVGHGTVYLWTKRA